MRSFNKKKYCIISSSRADFGILKNFIKKFLKKKNIKVDLILTGSHFSKKFGETYKEANENNIKNFYKLKLSNKNANAEDLSYSSSVLLKKLSKKFEKEKYHYLIILGDRFEIFIAAYVATLFKITIIHLSGGDETQAAYDNQFRHAISKLSHLHFPTNEISKNRIIQMGEDPKNVFNFGSLSLENIYKLKKIRKQDLEKEFRFKLKKVFFLVTFHPETLAFKDKKNLMTLLNAISTFKDLQFIFTSSNSDEGGDSINKIIKNFSKKRKNVFFVKSFGQEKYFNVIKYSSGIIGNSSSGVIEAPSFKVGTLNLGNRQTGRIKVKSVINTNFTKKDIIIGVKKILSKNFKSQIKNIKNPFYKNNSSEIIIKKILTYRNKNLLIKKFNDLKIYKNYS
jgi:UDP-hydrolysing UDP-N-acetyl-D-glucosamine 2-epimerase